MPRRPLANLPGRRMPPGLLSRPQLAAILGVTNQALYASKHPVDTVPHTTFQRAVKLEDAISWVQARLMCPWLFGPNAQELEPKFRRGLIALKAQRIVDVLALKALGKHERAQELAASGGGLTSLTGQARQRSHRLQTVDRNGAERGLDVAKFALEGRLF
jgi:hypothetical protein